MPAGDKTETTNVDIDVMKRMKRYSFDQYKIKAFSVWCITLPTDKLKWDHGVFNCPAFFKKFICKNIVGTAVRPNLCKPPPTTKHVQIDEKRRRGRLFKAKKAVLVQ